MASLFKKTFAVVLALAMVFTCLTANAASEGTSVNVSTAYSSDISKPVTVELHTKNFGTVYGSDLTITLPTGFTVVNNVVEVKSGFEWVKDSNYVVNGNVIRFLDVRTTEGFDVAFDVNIPAETEEGTYPITVTGQFVDAYEAACTVTKNAGAIVVRINTTSPVTGTTEGYFIPYGSVTSDGGFVDKNEDGSFDSGKVGKSFKLPEASIGVTTFSYSVKEEDENDKYEPGVQFGSYAVDTADKTYGTLVVMGDFDDFKSVYASMELTAIYNRLASIYNQNTPADGTLKVRYAAGKTITIALVAQTKYMWKGTVNGVAHLQYAVRVTNPIPRTYTSVAYNIANDVYTFSKESSAYTVVA
ncbi:MAG: hypothetical protein IJN15_04165 [Clostridia bacterium]|nr:hypothetical protein [Clostridia bacterium]